MDWVSYDDGQLVRWIIGFMATHWPSATDIRALQYTCGYCGREVASTRGWHTAGGADMAAYICPNCLRVSFFQDGYITPSALFGRPIGHLPSDVETVYNEARRSVQAQAYTGAALLCRKMLMHVAVEKGAAAGKPFAFYIDHLDAKGYVPPDGKGWVDHIRQMGNRGTHEISFFTREEAEELLTFTAMLLTLVYEFPGKLKTKSAAASESN